MADDAETSSGEPGPTGRSGVRWENWVHEQGFVPALAFDVSREEEIAGIIRQAVERGQRVHAAGAGLSSSPLVATDGALIETGRLSDVTLVPEDTLLTGAGRCVRALAGTRLDTLSAALDAHGLALPTLGSSSRESIAGAIATGVHGSGVGFGSLADLVRSVDLVDGLGRRWRVEPSKGFTRPGTEPRGVRRKEDDDWFHTAVVGLGVAGIVTSLVLEVRDAFDLEEQRTLTTWSALLASPTTHADIERAAHYELWLNPYAERPGKNTALVTLRSVAPKGTSRRPRPEPWLLNLGLVRSGLALVLDAIPALVPWALDTALASQVTRRPSVDASFRLFDSGPINRVPAVSSEWLFPMARWKEAVSALLAEAATLRVRPQAVGACPIGVRFVGASPHFLAMSQGQSGERFCSVAIPLFSTEHDRRTLQYRYDRVATRLGGRPHWGTHHRARPGRLARRYPEAPRFLRTRAAIDPDERFANWSAHAEGLTARPVRPPVLGLVNVYDSTVAREVLQLGAAPTRTQVDTRRFDVAASAADVARAFQAVLEQPGRLIARRFEVLRARGREGQPFVIGERFQGRFALDQQLLEDTRPRPSLWARLLRALGVRDALQALENEGLSNYGQLTELDLQPREGQPFAISYAYLTGTPFAGHSRFTVTPTGPGRCRYVEQLTFQPLDVLKQVIMETIGLRLHNHVVIGQVEAAADWLDVDFEPLDLDDLGTATGPLP